MNKTSFNRLGITACALLFLGSALSQQLGHVDLIHVPAEDLWEHGPVPASSHCEGESDGIMALGFVEAEHPKKITLEITKLSSSPVPLDGQIDAEVRLKNSSKDEIKIPWSRSPLKGAQIWNVNPSRSETGHFEFHLTYNDGADITLESRENPLYGSKGAPGSELELAPGQWITATVQFRMRADGPGMAHPGKARLTVKWRQAGVSYFDNGCRFVHKTYFYKSYYKQEMKARKIKIVNEDMLPLREALKHYKGDATR